MFCFCLKPCRANDSLLNTMICLKQDVRSVESLQTVFKPSKQTHQKSLITFCHYHKLHLMAHIEKTATSVGIQSSRRARGMISLGSGACAVQTGWAVALWVSNNGRKRCKNNNHNHNNSNNSNNHNNNANLKSSSPNKCQVALSIFLVSALYRRLPKSNSGRKTTTLNKERNPSD